MDQRNVKINRILNNQAPITINTGDTTYERPLTPAEAHALALEIEKQLFEKSILGFQENLHNIRRAKKSGEPYKDLYEYTLADVDIFFGRDEATKVILKSIKNQRFTVLQSESGAGKTSILQAGILPQLIHANAFPIYLRRPYNKTPSEALKQTFFRDPAQAPILSALRLNAFLCEMQEIVGSKTKVFILVDQFEEFFSVVDEKERQIFIKELAECINDTGLNVHWLLAVRTDSLGQLGHFQPDIPDPFAKSFHLKRLTSAQAEQIISAPAQKMGIEFEPGLVKQIIYDLGGENIAPPEVQLVCTTLRNKLGNQTIITRADYDSAGGAQGILACHLTLALKELTLPEQEIAHLVLETLVTSTQHRSMRTEKYLLEEFQNRKIEAERLRVVLKKLTYQRLIRSGEADLEPTYELTHDYLLGKISISDETKHFKEAQEILEQGVSNWEKCNVLLGPDALEIIEKRISPDVVTIIQAKLLLLSAIEYARPAEKWGQRLEIADLGTLKNYLTRNRQRNHAAQWALRDKLPWPQRIGLILWHYGSKGSWHSLQILKTLLLIMFVGLMVNIGITFTVKPVTSEHVKSFNIDCNNANPSENLMVAVDASDPSHVVAFDPAKNILCESNNSAASWAIINLALGQNIRALAVDQTIYLASADQVFWFPNDHQWHQTSSLSLKAPITSVSLDSTLGKIYLILESDQILAKEIGDLDGSSSWETVNLQGVDGHIRGFTVNYKYMAVNTSTGVWYTLKSELEWQHFEPLGYNGVVFKSISLTEPRKGFYETFINPGIADKIIALQEGGQTYFGFLTENSLTPFSIFAKASSLAITGTSTFLVNETGLACDQVWDITNWEWWLVNFSVNKPCSQQ